MTKTASPNTNCLAGVRCPGCGQADRLLITATVRATVTDDGADVAAGSDWQWDDASPAACPGCDREGPLGWFRDRPRPPDPDGMNDARAGWAGQALLAFRAATGTDPDDALPDLLADLMHWSDRHGGDFATALDRATGHYAAETNGEGRVRMTRGHANPFYAARFRRTAAAPCPAPGFVRLPQAPANASPVPRLTSLYAVDDPGPWGDRRYPGNCSGHLLHDLLLYFRPARVFDPFAGSGTAAAVCRDLGVTCQARDVRYGQDAASLAHYPRTPVPFVWAHPPYWRQKVYTHDPRDLSGQPTLDAFLERYGRVIANCAHALAPGGVLAVLMGDYADREAGFVPLTYHTQRLAFAAGLEQRHTAIVRFSHGASSGRKAYRSAFIPGLHDTCLLFTRPALPAGQPANPVAGSAPNPSSRTRKDAA